jgi:hypothetical protein
MSIQQYSLLSDFGSSLNEFQLHNNINASSISANLLDVGHRGDVIKLVFDADLTSGDIISLNDIVVSHTATALFPSTVSSVRGCIVSNNDQEPGDFTTIAAAAASGAVTIFIRAGKYLEDEDIIIPDWGQMIGESLGGVSLAIPYGNAIKCDGSGGINYTTGTVTIAHDSTTVTGAGTAFLTNVVAGGFILLGTNYFEVSSVDSDTSLTLTETYKGRALTNNTYRSQEMHTGLQISNMVIAYAAVPALQLTGVRHSDINNIAFSKCAGGLLMNECGDVAVHKVVNNYNTGSGITVNNSVSISVNTLNVFDSTTHGVIVSGDSTDIIMMSCASENNDGDGYHLDGTTGNVQIISCISKFNTGSGFHNTAGAHNVNITDSFAEHNLLWGILNSGLMNRITSTKIQDNSGGGINLEAGASVSKNYIQDNPGKSIHAQSTCEQCIISGNTITGGTSYGVYVECKNANVSNNIVNGCVDDGMHFATTSDDCIINGNRSYNNTGRGCVLDTGATDNIVTSNNFKGNTGTDLVDSGTGTELANNKFAP